MSATATTRGVAMGGAGRREAAMGGAGQARGGKGSCGAARSGDARRGARGDLGASWSTVAAAELGEPVLRMNACQ